MRSGAEARHQVVIVGGGPVGAALAVTLGLRGIRCALIESRVGLERIPKGQNLTQRTLEHFYFWGISDALRAARLMPLGFPIGEITAYGSLMSEYWQAPAGRETVRPWYFQDNERLPQYLTEGVLRQKLADCPTVETRYGWSAETIEQDSAGVRITVRDAAGSRREVLSADYVVGCDGARSIVRSQAGIASSGKDFDQRMVLAVFRSRGLSEGLKRFPPRSTYRVMHPDLQGYWQFFGRIDVEDGWFFHAPSPSDGGENLDVVRLIHKAAGFAFACEFDHIGFWDLRVAVAQRYQAGRAFIAGDAAHSHPPYGGFGLNNGLEDAVNLGWKLAATLQGWGGDMLLPSYGGERQPVFRDIAEDFIAARIARDKAFFDRYNPDRDRAEFERAWNANENDIRDRVQVYEPNYEGSPIVAGPTNGVCSAHGTHSFTARAGHHLAPLSLSSARNVYQELGPGFTLLALGVGDPAVDAFEQAARSLGVPLSIVRDRYQDQRTQYESRLVLVRPDQFVAWTGDEPPPDTAALMRKVVGRA